LFEIALSGAKGNPVGDAILLIKWLIDLLVGLFFRRVRRGFSHPANIPIHRDWGRHSAHQGIARKGLISFFITSHFT